jgi:glycopeptide antibiotics resistance protein
MIPIALLHFFTGSNYRGPCPGFVNGYLLDILVPFGFYFLLCLSEFYPLRLWIVKSILVFGAGSSVEIAQFFDVPIFGRTFDPVDLFMYGIGVILAAILDTIVFSRMLEFWTPKAKGST